MKRMTLIPTIAMCAAFALTGCDQAQTPSGEAPGAANDQGQSMKNPQSQGQSGSNSQSGSATQSSTGSRSTYLAREFALLDRSTKSAPSTRWTLISEPAGVDPARDAVRTR